MEQILQDKDLTMSEKGLMCYLVLNKEQIFKSKLMGSFGEDRQTIISTTFDSLCKKGYIEPIVNGKDFKFNIYNIKQRKQFKTIAEIRFKKIKTPIYEHTIWETY